MPAAFYDDEGNHLKACTKCQITQPVTEYYRHTAGVTKDGLQPRCRACTLANYREQNARRAKKRKQRTYKLSPHHVEGIREQQHKLSTRQTAKAFAEKFHAMKINPVTVHRIFTGELHPTPEQQQNKLDKTTISIYDVLERVENITGSVEDYIETLSDKKIKY